MAIALIQSAYGIQITASGGSNGESGSVAMNFDTLKDTSVSSQIAINGADITPNVALVGPITKFEQTHSVKDASGKSASVYVKVLNAPNGLTYTFPQDLFIVRTNEKLCVYPIVIGAGIQCTHI